MNKTINKKFAKLAVRIGANVKKGQRVVVVASTDSVDLALAIQEECYKCKAKSVEMKWTNDKASKCNMLNQSLETLSEIDDWEIEKQKYYNKELPVQIYIEDSDPDAMAGIDNEKITKAQLTRWKVLKPLIDQRDCRYQWCIIAKPSTSWAMKVFPNEKPKVAVKKLWEAIIKCTRLEGKNPIKDWKEHLNNLKVYADKMNDYNFDYLEYKSKNGTNLKIYLQPNHMWMAASEKTLGKGIEFTANMPTEEVFTMPKKDGVDGVVVSTKPLSYRGQLIEDFKVYFKDGKAYKVEAKKGQELLENLIKTDEGSCYLGEVALVPFSSPISQSNILFYNTLFDENASCHLAFGESYKNTVKGYEKMNEEDWKKANKNSSSVHVDFMVGAEDLEIIGTTFKGEKIKVFHNGNWNI